MFEDGESGEGFWRASFNLRAAMVAFSVDDLYGIFPYCGKTLQCQRLIRVRFGLHTRCGSDNDLMMGRCTNLHICVLSKFLLLQVYHA